MNKISKITLGKKELVQKLIETVSKHKNLTYIKNKDISEIINLLLDVIVECIESGYDLKINGFLRLNLKLKSKRFVRNPRYGINTEIQERLGVVCKTGSKFDNAAKRLFETLKKTSE